VPQAPDCGLGAADTPPERGRGGGAAVVASFRPASCEPTDCRSVSAGL